ncbi:MAG: hypothetical protein D6713_02990, partial [Deltaproteobacteria bacterium]
VIGQTSTRTAEPPIHRNIGISECGMRNAESVIEPPSLRASDPPSLGARVSRDFGMWIAECGICHRITEPQSLRSSEHPETQ